MTKRIKRHRKLKAVDRNVTDYCTGLLSCYCIKFNILFKLYLCTGTVISLYRGRLGVLKTHCYIRNIVIVSKIVISGFCPIHFTATFART